MEYPQLKSFPVLWLIVLLCHWNLELVVGAPLDFTISEEEIQSVDKTTRWWDSNSEIQLLQEYLRIPCVHPDPDYAPAVEFLKHQANALNLPINVYYPSLLNKPVVVISWQGSESDLPAILLNSHMDTVPVYPELWTHLPFGAEIDDDGKLFARGSEDSKSQGMSYLGAMRQLKNQGYEPKRTIHITYVPDEEIGGIHGMKAFTESRVFKDLNVIFAIDEGLITIDNATIYYAEKISWRTIFTAHGETGHASFLPEQTAGNRLSGIIFRLMNRRHIEVEKLKNGVPLSNLTSINLTQFFGGIQSNVLPKTLSAAFDIRFAPDEDLDAFQIDLDRWINESGGGIDISFEQKGEKVPLTVLEGNPQFLAMQKVLNQFSFDVNLNILPVTSDARHLRTAGIPTISFIPSSGLQFLGHKNNEYIKVDIYLELIENFLKIILALTN